MNISQMDTGTGLGFILKNLSKQTKGDQEFSKQRANDQKISEQAKHQNSKQNGGQIN